MPLNPVVARLFRLEDLIRSKKRGMTKAEIFHTMPAEYPVTEAGERKFFRDLEALVELGRVERIRPPWEPAIYITPEDAAKVREEYEAKQQTQAPGSTPP